MTRKKLIFMGIFVFSFGFAEVGRTQDEVDIPFDDLEAELEAQDSPQSSAQSPGQPPAEKEPPKGEAVKTAPETLKADEELDNLLGENQFLDTPEEDALPEENEPPKEAPQLAKPESTEEETDPLVQELEEDLGEPTKPQVAEDIPPALREDAPKPELAVRPSEDPSDLIYKIPVKPPMSEANWKKWAGPTLEKSYKIRKGDTLWAISERLFGNPYLWPKIWQLNARFGNPHEVDPNVEITFAPGLPNSAPAMAVSVDGVDQGMMSIVEFDPPLSLIDRLERILGYQRVAPEPAYKYFLVDARPEPLLRLPRQPIGLERKMYIAGDWIQAKDLAPGTYSIIDTKSLRGDSKLRRVGFEGFIVKWIGTLEVNAEGIGRVKSTFAEIEEGAAVIAENYWIPALSLRQEVLGADVSRKTRIVPVEEGTLAGGSANTLLGLILPEVETGPTPGAILTLRDDVGIQGYGLLVHRQGRTATMWIIEGNKEISGRNVID